MSEWRAWLRSTWDFLNDERVVAAVSVLILVTLFIAGNFVVKP